MYREELLKITQELRQCKQQYVRGKIWIDIPDPLIRAMQDLPPIKEMIGRNVNLGTASRTINVHDVAELLVMGASQKGFDVTIDSLIAYAGIDYTPCVQVLLLRGIKVSNTFEILDDVYIAKPEDVPSLSLSRFLNQYQFRLHSEAGFSNGSPFSNYEADYPPDSVIYKVSNAQPKFFPMDIDPYAFEESTKKHLVVRTISSLLPLIFPEVGIRYNYYASSLKNSFLEDLAPQSWSLSGWGGYRC